DASTVTIEQSFFKNRLGFEAALNKEYYRLDYYQPFGSNGRNAPIYIDTTLYLNDTTLNPNVGRAMMIQATDSASWRNTARLNRRVTAFLDFNFKDLNPTLGKWFGRHTFTGLLQKERTVNTGLNYTNYLQGTNFDYNRAIRGDTTDANVRNLLNAPAVFFSYISDDLRGKEMNQVRLNPISQNRLVAGDTFNVNYFDITPLPGTNLPTNQYKNGSVRVNTLNNGSVANRTDVTSKALAWQSNLVSNHIVGLVGLRQDRIESYRQTNNNIRSASNEILPAVLGINGFPSTNQMGHTFTWSVVGHVPREWIEKTQRFVTSASAHYGRSENFAASGERHDVFNNLLSSPSGTTKEYGVTLGFAKEKWFLKLNRYESASEDVGILGAQTGASITEVTRPLNNYQASLNANLPFTSLSSYPALAAAGYSSYDQLFTAIKNFIPEPTRSLYPYRVLNGTWGLPGGAAIFGVSSTQSVQAKGWEAELTGNPRKNWRVSASVAQTEATPSLSAAPLAAFQEQYVANMKAAKLDGVVEGPASITTMLGRYNQSYVSATVQTRAKDGAANQELRKYRFNFLNKYTFSDGRLKGLGIGGNVRWQSDVTIGYASRLNADAQPVAILEQPYKGPSELSGDIVLSYSRKVTEKINWEIQLNTRNLLSRNKDVPVAADPDGRRTVFRIAPEKAWYVTNTFSF
ncbi:MAG: hypothetical protein ABIQ12_14005, partial [Opitutaceae bacterium]